MTDAPVYPEERYDLIWTVSDSKFTPTVQPMACTEPKVYDQVPTTSAPVSEVIAADSSTAAVPVPTDVQRISEAPTEREAERATEQASIGM